MEWDLGLQGLALLLGMSVAAGLVTALLAGRAAPRWLGPVTAVAYLAFGLFVSEVWFGWATEEDLQPNVDGLSFDEVLLLGLLPVTVAVVSARLVARRRHGAAGRHVHPGH